MGVDGWGDCGMERCHSPRLVSCPSLRHGSVRGDSLLRHGGWSSDFPRGCALKAILRVGGSVWSAHSFSPGKTYGGDVRSHPAERLPELLYPANLLLRQQEPWPVAGSMPCTDWHPGVAMEHDARRCGVDPGRA